MGEPLNGASQGRDARVAGLSGWRADWAGLRVVVLGLGATGFSAADTLAELGARVVVVAGAATAQRRELARVIGAEHIEADGSAAAEALVAAGPDLVVVSPGYPPDHPALRAAAGHGIPVWGDLELAWRLRDKVGPPAEWVLVAGGDDVAPTAELTAAMLVAGGVRAAPAGTPDVNALDALRDPHGFDVLVIGVSGRQLARRTDDPAGAPAPLASICLTAAGAESPEELALVYADSRVACVYQLSEAATREFVEEADVQEGCRAIGIGLGVPGPSDLGIVDGILVDRAFLDERRSHALELATLDDLAARGLTTPAEVGRVLAAAALARAAGAPPRAVRDGLAAPRLG